MIDTLMALWNRGYSGRGIMVSIAFALICISISLLLVTVGGSWASLFAQRPTTYPRSIVGTADLSATAQASGIQPVADNTVTFQAPTATAQPCATLTPRSGKTPATHVSATAYRGGNYPRKPTVTPTRPRPTPTPIRLTPTPVRATPTPTVTPTVVVTITPTATPTPVITPTPTNTPTPIVTPTATPTPVITPTITPTVGVTPTITVGITPTSSPIVIITQTHQKHLHGGTPVAPVGTGTGTTGQNGNGGTTWRSTGCNHAGTVGDTLDMHSSDGSIAAALERDVWLILGGSTGGTLLFYASVYFMMRKRVRK